MLRLLHHICPFGSQRRCQILLTLFRPGLTATMATFSELNGVDDDIASLDISETGRGDPALSSTHTDDWL